MQQVKSFVCRATIVPSQSAEEDMTLSTQSITLGDELVGVTKNVSFMNMQVINEFVKTGLHDNLHFYYSTPLYVTQYIYCLLILLMLLL